MLYFKYPFGEGSGLVENYGVDLSNSIQIVSSFEQDSGAGSCSDTSKIA